MHIHMEGRLPLMLKYTLLLLAHLTVSRGGEALLRLEGRDRWGFTSAKENRGYSAGDPAQVGGGLSGKGEA